MKIKLVLRKNPLNPEESKYYAAPVNDGKMSLDDIAEQIAGRASITSGDILSVLQNFVEVIPLFLMMGKSVNLGKLGILRLSLGCEGVETEEDFNISLIKKKRILFTPSPALKMKISAVKFETVK